MSLDKLSKVSRAYDEKKKRNVDNHELTECTHENTIEDSRVTICVDCGQEIFKAMPNNREWRYYSKGDSRFRDNPTRVHQRKKDEPSIHRDLAKYNFSDNIVDLIVKLYKEVTGGKIYRAKRRDAIIYGCTYYAFRMLGNNNTSNLARQMGVSSKNTLKGIKHVSLHTKNPIVRKLQSTPKDIICEIMSNMRTSNENKAEVLDLYSQISDRSSRLNRSRPRSIAAGLIYYWSQTKRKHIDITEFAREVSLSNLTIRNIAQEIGNVLEKTD